MATFALTTIHGPGWDDSRGIRDQVGWTEHAEFMDGLVAEGLILLGGPLRDGRQTLHVVEAPDEEAIRRRLAEDPWARAGRLQVGSIQPWALWLDFRRLAPGNDTR
ncbi:MAG: YciI family protein [bacterium]